MALMNRPFAGRYLTRDMQWHGGTVGTVKGRTDVAGLFAGAVTSLPNAHVSIKDIFGQGDQVVVRVVVRGTQKGALLGIPATGRDIRWDGVDVYRVYRMTGGKISATGPATTVPRSSTTPARTRRPGSAEPIPAHLRHDRGTRTPSRAIRCRGRPVPLPLVAGLG
jgi:hypothetical protein